MCLALKEETTKEETRIGDGLIALEWLHQHYLNFMNIAFAY